MKVKCKRECTEHLLNISLLTENPYKVANIFD